MLRKSAESADEFALPKTSENAKASGNGMEYDKWFFESELHKSGEVSND